MTAGDARVTLVETLDVNIADAVERAVRARGVNVWRSRIEIPLADPRLRQQATRLEVSPGDEPVARDVADELMMRRARLLSFPRARRGDGDIESDGGINVDVGGTFDGGDSGDAGGSSD
jgi:hypothetical protein